MRSHSALGRGRHVALGVALATALAVAAAAHAAEPQTVPAGAATRVPVPQSNIVATCSAPGSFVPNPTKWSINPSSVGLGGATGEMPAAGSSLVVAVPANHSPYQPITISWTGNTDCVSYNGTITLSVSGAAAKPVVAKPKARKTSAKTFALAGVLLANRTVDLVRAFRRAPENQAAGNAVWQQAILAGATWDLAKFAKPKTLRLERNKLGAKLRQGQLEALPGFARDLEKISEYEQVMVDMTNAKYAADPEFHSILDTLAAANYGDVTTYESLDAKRKADVASQVQGLSGSLQVLLRMAQNAGKSAAHVVTGQ